MHPPHNPHRPASTPMPAERFVRIAELAHMTGLSKTTLYKYVGEQCFPRPVCVGSNRVAWLESEVLAWMQARIAARRP